MSRVMAIDYGTKRIGVALSDPLRMIASGFETISWNGIAVEYAIDRIAQIVIDKGVDEIVIGSPLRTDGGVSSSKQKAEDFGDLLSQKTGITPVYRDERYTTVIASRTMNEIGVAGQDRKKIVDQLAAQIILREYLEIHRPET